MKCNELQLGNYVLIKPSGKLISIAAIHQKKVGYHNVPTKLEWVRQSMLNPIFLTDDILEKNFPKNEGDNFQLCRMWRIWPNPDYGYVAAIMTIDNSKGEVYEACTPCRYVHELQNLLTLLKVNKKIIL